ncbi:hypothetical protein AB4376_18295 [Vibrio breoganii]
MFSKNEIKEFIVKYGKKWLFPDFTNKLTWFVASIGGAILLTPTILKEIIYNWLVETINLNSGEYFTLAELKSSSADYFIGAFLVVIALSHNVANRYFIYKTTQIGQSEVDSLLEVDRNLFTQFLADFPSDSQSISLLKEHDFGGSYHENNTKQIDKFVDSWNTAEREFLDSELEVKRKELWGKCHTFIYMLANRSYVLHGGPMCSCVPDAYRGAWDWPPHVDEQIKELNELSTECYELHQELVLLARRKLKC